MAAKICVLPRLEAGPFTVGAYDMYALQESARQMRGTPPAQIPDGKISVCHGAGGMFAASGTIIVSNDAP